MNHLNQPRLYSSGSRSPGPQQQHTQHHQQQQQQQQQQASNSSNKADYVYFDRTTTGFSEDAVHKAKAAQLKLEHFYKVAVESAIERNQR